MGLAGTFAFGIEEWVYYVLNKMVLILLLWSLVDSLIRRKDAYVAIGTLPKVGWILILVLAALVMLSGSFFFTLIGAGVAAYYLLDVRRGLREITEGPW